MELRLLRSFAVLAETAHFGRAAERLHLTPSALSQQIARLEREAGCPLLERTSRSVRLTPVGAAFLERAGRVLREADELEAALRSYRDGQAGRLTIGLQIGGAGPLTAPMLAAFRTARPNVAVAVRELPPDGVEALLEGRVDIALLHGPQRHDDRIELTELFTEPRVTAVAAASPLADAPTLEAGDLVGLPAETRNPTVPPEWEGFFTLVPERGGEQPERVGDPASTFDEVLWNIGLNDVVLTLPWHVADSHPAERFGVRYVPAPDLAPVPLMVATRRGAADPLVTAFREIAQRVTADLLGLIPGAQRRSS
jgi:DNA-binding transcriptional LysR family regulator